MGLKDDGNSQKKSEKTVYILLRNCFISYDIVQCIDGSLDPIQVRD